MANGPHSPSGQRHVGTDIALSAVISLVAIILAHQRQVSLHNIVIGKRALPIFEMAGLELLVGAVTSLLVVGICALALRCFSLALIVTAAVVQILWLEFEWGFSMKATDAGELMVRFAGELGVIAATIALVLLNLWKTRRRAGLGKHA
jgi:hypothetical protein